MDNDSMKIENDRGVMVITLNRPEKLNALTTEDFCELSRVLDNAATDDAVKVVVLTATGRGFCTGADLSGMASGGGGSLTAAGARQFTRLVARAALSIRHLDKPCIAVVNGTTAGAGLGLALACDVRFASDQAKFTPVFLQRGLVPDGCVSYLLPRAIGPSRAFDWLWSGEKLGAEAALKMGLIDYVVPAEELNTKAMEYAYRVAEGPMIAIRAAKRVIYQGLEMSIDATANLESEAQASCALSEDATEGAMSFFEKRKPEFKGR